MSQPLQIPGGPPLHGLRTILVGSAIIGAGFAGFYYGLHRRQERREDRELQNPGAALPSWQTSLHEANYPARNAAKPSSRVLRTSSLELTRPTVSTVASAGVVQDGAGGAIGAGAGPGVVETHLVGAVPAAAQVNEDGK